MFVIVILTNKLVVHLVGWSDLLKSWKAQGMGDPEQTRSALLKVQQMNGVADSFQKEGPIIMATKGATGKPGPEKHVLEEAEQGQYEDFILNAKVELLGGCRSCRMELASRQGRLVLLWASRFIQAVPCRLMNLREFKGFHLEADEDRVFVEHLKTAGGGPGYLWYWKEKMSFPAATRTNPC